MSNFLSSAQFQVLDNNGDPVVGAKAYFYLAGTTTPQDVYQENALTTPHAVPVVADSTGAFAPIYVDRSIALKLVLKDADDVTVRTIDNISTNPGDGDVVGPASATDNALPRFNGTGGKALQTTDIIVDDSNNLSGVNDITVSGNQSFGISPYANVLLTFGGTISGSASVFSTYMADTIYQPNSGGNSYGYRSGGVVDTVNGNQTAAYGFYGTAFSKSGANTITNVYGMYLAAQTIGTNNYSLVAAGAVLFQNNLSVTGGLVAGSPTGGNKGNGTINATAVYDDNVLLTCYVFDAYRDGAIDNAKWDAKVPDRTVKGEPEITRQKTVSKTRMVEKIKIVKGKEVKVEVEETYDEPAFKETLLFNESGKPIMVTVSPAIDAKPAMLDESGKVVVPAVEAKKAVIKQKVHREPVMEVVPAVPDKTINRTHEDMRKFKARLGTDSDPLDLEKYINHWKTKGHLSSMPNEETFDPEKGMSTGSWLQRLIETVELQAIHISQLHDRIKALENR